MITPKDKAEAEAYVNAAAFEGSEIVERDIRIRELEVQLRISQANNVVLRTTLETIRREAFKGLSL